MKNIIAIAIFMLWACVSFAQAPKNVILFIGDGMSVPQRMIAEELSRKTGARGLRALLEKLMLDVMYEAPDRRGHGACVVTADMVRARTTHLEPRKASASQPPAPAQASLLA